MHTCQGLLRLVLSIVMVTKRASKASASEASYSRYKLCVGTVAGLVLHLHLHLHSWVLRHIPPLGRPSASPTI